MNERTRHVVDFYTRHPISAEQVLAKLAELRGGLERLAPQELYAHDQDHYGGLAANEALARAAALRPGERVADFCAGIGGPARWYALQYGVTVTGFDLNPSRVAGGNALTRRVGLDDRVKVIEADVTRTLFPDAQFDAVLSQEAFLHVPDKGAVLREAFRLLRPGGRLAFTDWIAHRALSDVEADTMWRGIAAQTVQTPAQYDAVLDAAGFRERRAEDLTGEWSTVLAERLAMYRRLREETLARGLPAGDEAFYTAYVSLVALVQARVLGGMRFVAVRPHA